VRGQRLAGELGEDWGSGGKNEEKESHRENCLRKNRGSEAAIFWDESGDPAASSVQPTSRNSTKNGAPSVS
jgi:hypothetical protein